MGKAKWRSAPTDVEKSADEVWLGVKCQSNPELAGSPRNAFRCSVTCFLPEVEHWMADGPDKVTDVNQTPNAGK